MGEFHPVLDFFAWSRIKFKANTCCCVLCIEHKGNACARELQRRLGRLRRKAGVRALEVGRASSEGEFEEILQMSRGRPKGSKKCADGLYRTPEQEKEWEAQQSGARCPF